MRYLPDALSVLRAAIGVASALLVPQRGMLFGLFVAAAVTDFADGKLARRFRWQTAFGAGLDLACDGCYFLCALVALHRADRLPLLWFVLVVFGAVPEVLAQLVLFRRSGATGSFGRPVNKALGGYSYLFVLAVAAGWHTAVLMCGMVFLQLASNGGDLLIALTSSVGNAAFEAPRTKEAGGIQPPSLRGPLGMGEGATPDGRSIP